MISAGEAVCVACTHAYHQAAIDAAELDHAGRGEKIEDDLLRRPRLHPRRACEHLGAGLDQDTMARQLKKRRAPVVRHCNAQRPPRCCGTQGSDRERRRAAGCDSYDDVVLMNFSLGDGFCAFCFVVFGALHACSTACIPPAITKTIRSLGQSYVGPSTAPS